MLANIAQLNLLARQGLMTAQTASPGVHLLRTVACGESVFSPVEFWDRWPGGGREDVHMMEKQSWSPRKLKEKRL